MSLGGRISRAWHRWSLRRRQYSGGARVIDALYGTADPWNLASPEEQVRFAATNSMILRHFPKPESLLEIGCGEGHQTRYFLRLAARVTGIDVSGTALQRAAQAVPDAAYMEGDIADLLPSLPLARYDVATLCEVLYYMDDPALALHHAQGCADHVIVTVYAPQARRLASLFVGEGWRTLEAIQCGRRRWNAHVWSRPTDAA